MRPNRLQMFSLISAFERDLREMLKHYVVHHLGEIETLGEYVAQAELRRAQDGAIGDSLLEWLDIRPEYELLNRHRTHLPAGLAQELRELTLELEVIEPIRHTIMHSRPLRPQDAERLFTALSKFVQPQWNELRNVIKQLNADATWTPEESLPEIVQERVKHNLPLTDYDETGLLGRDSELKQITTALKRRRDSVITLTGEGGIGKSALALATAYNLLDDSMSPFEMVLWVTLKTERLTAYGVEQITNSIETLNGATSYLEEVAGSVTPIGELDALANEIGDTSTLIIFDNLETISGEEFLRLYETLPTTVSYLVTSRQGIGQVERRFPVGPLKEADALDLLNQLIRSRSVKGLQKISGETRKVLVQKLRYSPLAIRWYVLSVEAGRDPLESIHDQSELVNYCVGNVFHGVGTDARLCLTAMHLIDRPVFADDLVVLTKMSVPEVRAALQELVRGSLVTHSTSDDLKTLVQISESAKAYLNSSSSQDEALQASVEALELQLTQFEGRRQQDENQRSLAPIVIRTRSATDRPVAFLLREAMLASQSGDYQGALLKIGEARELSPEYWEVWRVDAFLQAPRNPASASSKYRQAYSLAKENPEHRAVVAHFFAGHLARNEHNLEEAEPFAREAHEALKLADTARALGSLLIWRHEFDEGLSLLMSTYAEPDLRGKSRLITVTALTDGYRRKGEHALQHDANPFLAWNACWVGWNFGARELDRGISDSRLLESLLECAKTALQSLRVAHESGIAIEGHSALFAGVQRRLKRLSVRTQGFEYFAQEVQRLSHTGFATSRLNELLSTLADMSASSSADALSGREKPTEDTWIPGLIHSIKDRDGYGFIEHEDYPENIFFHRSALEESVKLTDLTRGDTINFVVDVDQFGRHRAKRVRIESISVSQIQEVIDGQIPRIESEKPAEDLVDGFVEFAGNKFSFAVTDLDGYPDVMVREDVVEGSGLMASLRIGDRVRLRVLEEDSGKARATEIVDFKGLMEQQL